MGKLSFWFHVALWGSVAIQIAPIYLSARIFLAYPRIQDWSSAWIFFILSMLSVAARRVVVAATFDDRCEVNFSWFFDQVLMTYMNSALFWIFASRKQRFFLRWFSSDKLKD